MQNFLRRWRWWLWVIMLAAGLAASTQVVTTAYAVNLGARNLLHNWPQNVSWTSYATGQTIAESDRLALLSVMADLEPATLIGQSKSSYLRWIIQTMTLTLLNGEDEHVILSRLQMVKFFDTVKTIRIGDDFTGIVGLQEVDGVVLLFAMGRQFDSQGDVSRAILYYTAAHDHGYDPATRRLAHLYQDRITQAHNYIQTGDQMKARAELEQIISANVDPFTTDLARLEWALSLDDLVLAEQTWLTLVHTSKDPLLQRLSIEYLIKFYLDQARYCEANDLAERGIELFPDSGTFYYYQGRAYEGLMAWQQAHDAYQQAVDRFPNYGPYEKRLGHSIEQAEINPSTSPTEVCPKLPVSGEQ